MKCRRETTEDEIFKYLFAMSNHGKKQNTCIEKMTHVKI